MLLGLCGLQADFLVLDRVAQRRAAGRADRDGMRLHPVSFSARRLVSLVHTVRGKFELAGEPIGGSLAAVYLKKSDFRAPLLAFGIGSLVYWHCTNDLRWYGVVQFGPMLVIPVLLAARPSRYLRTADVWIVLGWYAAAKALEHADAAVFSWGRVVSGHTL